MKKRAQRFIDDHREPLLDELLDDPIVQAVMARDGVDRPTLERLIRRTQRRLGFPAPSALFEAELFAECGT